MLKCLTRIGRGNASMWQECARSANGGFSTRIEEQNSPYHYVCYSQNGLVFWGNDGRDTLISVAQCNEVIKSAKQLTLF